MKKILVTGGAGYIGSHTTVELIETGYVPVIADSLVNSKPAVLDRIEKITGTKPALYVCDIRDKAALREIFQKESPDAVIHFAGLKAVGESVAEPLLYYDNNVNSTLVLLETMREHGVDRIVFSSSATVYGDPASVPVREDFPLHPTNPYGRTKLMIEEILRDAAAAYGLNAVLLRYFNPVGAHPSGMIGEDPNGIPNNLVPYITRVAAGRLERIHVFGGDYPTPDGTGVRDYLHVCDLARGHVAALRRMERTPGIGTYNLGTGRGCSVLEMIRTFSKVCGRDLPYTIEGRRPGDIAEVWADSSLAKAELGWECEYGLERMAEDSWRWQRDNPDGL